jgi:hypothetical protein
MLIDGELVVPPTAVTFPIPEPRQEKGRRRCRTRPPAIGHEVETPHGAVKSPLSERRATARDRRARAAGCSDTLSWSRSPRRRSPRSAPVPVAVRIECFNDFDAVALFGDYRQVPDTGGTTAPRPPETCPADEDAVDRLCVTSPASAMWRQR